MWKNRKKSKLYLNCFQIWAHTESFVTCQYEKKIQCQKEIETKNIGLNENDHVHYGNEVFIPLAFIGHTSQL